MAPTRSWRPAAAALAVLLLLVVVLKAAADPFSRRQTVWLDLPSSSRGDYRHRDSGPFPLRFPRMLPLPSGPPPATAFRLRVNDTCGLFTVFQTIHQPAGAGPPPHIHYGEDEFFISAGTGDTRVFTHQRGSGSIKPGRLPGFNVPPIEAGSAVLTGTGNGVDRWGGQLVMSPAGSVHYFVRETAITDFFTIYLDGFADEDVINYILYGSEGASSLDVLLNTGLYSIPTDMTGRFVGRRDDTGALKLYRDARGPIDVPDARAQAKRLQKLFDAVEERRCCKGCVW